MRVIPEPEPDTRAVLIKAEGAEDDTVFIRGGQTGFIYSCGSCGAPLMVDIAPKQVQDLVLKCSACGSFNESSIVPGYN